MFFVILHQGACYLNFSCLIFLNASILYLIFSMQITHCSPHSILFLQSQFRWCGQGFFSVSPSCIFFNLIIPSFLTLQSLGTPPYLRRSRSQCTSSGQKIWIYLIFPGRGLRRAFPLLLSPPPSPLWSCSESNPVLCSGKSIFIPCYCTPLVIRVLLH